MSGLRRRLSYANVIATLALFLALTGSAAAVGKYLTASDPITAGDLAGSTYGNPVIAGGKVTSAKITDGAITSSKFDSAAIAPNSDKLDGLDSSAFVQQPGGASLFFASASSAVNIPSTTPVTVASLDVPAGTYLVSAQLAVFTDALFCTLQPSGTDAGSNGIGRRRGHHGPHDVRAGGDDHGRVQEGSRRDLRAGLRKKARGSPGHERLSSTSDTEEGKGGSMRRFSRKKMLALLGLAVAGALMAGTALATIGDGGVISACYKKDGGGLRVLDPATSSCSSKEGRSPGTSQGPKGDKGEPGPPGPAGTLGTLDDLEGIPCKGTKAHPGTVHVSYGRGSETESPVSLTCVTTVVLNPGPFTVHVTGGTLQVGIFGETPLPTSGWQFSGRSTPAAMSRSRGRASKSEISISRLRRTFAGFAGVHVTGTTSLASTGTTGSLDPESGAASLSGGCVCNGAADGDRSDPGSNCPDLLGHLLLRVRIEPDLVDAHDRSSGRALFTEQWSRHALLRVHSPVARRLQPGRRPALRLLLGTFAGSGRVTLSGTSDPIIKAP